MQSYNIFVGKFLVYYPKIDHTIEIFFHISYWFVDWYSQMKEKLKTVDWILSEFFILFCICVWNWSVRDYST